ncbi:MAG: hypothetical protein HXY50_10645 [Ignavibacteriaceae bacterium]|nr:hypothetical protein [Ignavibacteriaceae bacterium]
MSSNDYKLQTITDETIANFDAAEVVNLGFNAAFLKLKDSYLEKGKFTKYEFDSFKKALRDIADDFKDGGINRGLYYYLDANMEQLNKHSYTDKYHSILEYLVKVMRNTIREHLVEGKQ